MTPSALFRREIAIALRARVTWLVFAGSALLVGHGFVLALDLYSAASRSALGNVIMRREIDPLPGIVRPTLGGMQLATALLVPILAARLLSVEKERNTFGMLSVAIGSTAKVALIKLAAAAMTASGVLVMPAMCFAAFSALGGHVDPIETIVALSGHLLCILAIAALSVAASSWTGTVAQATTLAILVSIASWAVEAGEGISALAWLGPFEAASLGRQLSPFEHGLVSVGSLAWFGSAMLGALASTVTGASFGLGRWRKPVAGLIIAASTLCALGLSHHLTRTYDWTELRRASLPPHAVEALRAIDRSKPISITVFLDREDSRRQQLERDTLSKLRLARSDLEFVMPLDDKADASEAGLHDDRYGEIVVRVGDANRVTRSTSRREITSLIFDAAGLPVPDWSQEQYAGYPLVVGESRARIVRLVVYLIIPSLLLLVGWLLRRPIRRHHADSVSPHQQRP